jgi:hypothetical protein
MHTLGEQSEEPPSVGLCPFERDLSVRAELHSGFIALSDGGRRLQPPEKLKFVYQAPGDADALFLDYSPRAESRLQLLPEEGCRNSAKLPRQFQRVDVEGKITEHSYIAALRAGPEPIAHAAIPPTVNYSETAQL